MESAEDYSQPPAREMGVPAAWCHRYADLIHIVILLEVLEMECPQMVLSSVCVMSGWWCVVGQGEPVCTV